MARLRPGAAARLQPEAAVHHLLHRPEAAIPADLQDPQAVAVLHQGHHPAADPQGQKKIVITSILAFAALGAGAQTAYDAMTFSENNYSGTARTIAMGNAFTALGGDLGSYGINPAGSAVNRYSQISFTPNLSSLSSSSEYFANPMDNAARSAVALISISVKDTDSKASPSVLWSI